jgi:signal transduction histidine kinase
VGALQHRLDAVEGRAGVQARLLADETLELSGAVEEELYHIAQEALNNALKHAGATAVTVQINASAGQVELVITYNGHGFDPAAVGQAGLGLTSMRERAAKLGGSLSIVSAPGQGATVKVSVKVN